MITTMKFSVFAITALAATMSCAAAASQKIKIQKQTSSLSRVPNFVKKTSVCVIPPGLDHAVCCDGQCQSGAHRFESGFLSSREVTKLCML